MAESKCFCGPDADFHAAVNEMLKVEGVEPSSCEDFQRSTERFAFLREGNGISVSGQGSGPECNCQCARRAA